MMGLTNLTNTILVVGDGHVTDNQDLSRFDMLGSLIVSKRPDHIMLMGDFVTLDCLSSWDRDKRKKMEGRRYQLEIDAGNAALDRMMRPLWSLQGKQRKAKDRLYSPNIVYLEGNHEDRLTRYLDYDPTFSGFANIKSNLHLGDRGITWVPYRGYYDINGIHFTHIPFNKAAPIASVNICRAAELVCVQTTVFGHTHEFSVSNVHRAGQGHLQQLLNCGCFFDHTDEYAQGCMTNYWRGVMMLHNYKECRFDLETISLGHMRRIYG